MGNSGCHCRVCFTGAFQMSDDIDIMARTIYGESRGEGDKGMKAVANVIMRRAYLAGEYMEAHHKPHPLFGDGSPRSACKMPWQFSCWNAKDPNCSLISGLSATDPSLHDALGIADNAFEGLLSDYTNEATHYVNLAISKPDWIKKATMTAIIGHHTFYKNVH